MYQNPQTSHGMRNLILILASVISFSAAFLVSGKDNQSPKNKKYNVNIAYFILGTLSDNMGRFHYVNKAYEVDIYDTYEIPLMDYLDKLIQKEFKIEVVTISGAKTPDKYETYSKSLSEKLNSFYRKESLLIDGLFTNPEEISSFLMGRYYRFGRKVNDSIYVIQLVNSPNHKILDSLLKAAGCSRIHLKYLKNTPVQFICYFVPSPELEKYFFMIAKQKEKLNNSYDEHMMRLLVMGKDEYNKLKKDLNDKEVSEITKIFTTEGLKPVQ